MFKRILVPMDGSLLAEAALPVASAFGRAFGARVTLMHVLEKNAPSEIHNQRHLREKNEAGAYLEATMKRVADAAVEVHVHEEKVGNVARGIAQHAAELRADLVVLCTHGSGGLKRLFWGTIAQRVVAADQTPVVLVPSGRAAVQSYACRCIMLPLDGKKEHESGLEPALACAQSFGASLIVLLAVPRQNEVPGKWSVVSRLLPSATREILDQTAGGAQEYLEQLRGLFMEKNVAFASELVRGNPAKAITFAIDKRRPDLVVLGTHGKAGLDALFEGSVGARICATSNVPVLLAPAKNP